MARLCRYRAKLPPSMEDIWRAIYFLHFKLFEVYFP
nr:MAG TPA: hypothetical protein [Caudoviricetes sp.]